MSTIDPPVPPDYASYEELEDVYRLHIQAETAWLREMNRQRGIWERRTLQLQAQLQPYWDEQIRAKFGDQA